MNSKPKIQPKKKCNACEHSIIEWGDEFENWYCQLNSEYIDPDYWCNKFSHFYTENMNKKIFKR